MKGRDHGMDLDTLARYAQYPNAKISYTTVEELRAIGIQIAPTPFAHDPLHHTVIVSNPLPYPMADALSVVFSKKIDKLYRSRQGRNLSLIDE